MRCIFLPIFAVCVAASTALASAAPADEEIRQPSTSAESETTVFRELANLGSSPQEAVAESATAGSTKSKSGVPTPAKRRPADVATSVDSRASDVPTRPTVDLSAAEPSASPVAGKQSDGKKESPGTKDEPLRPIPDSLESGPVSIEAASFKGVSPGISTKEDVAKAWGQPKESSMQNGALVQRYSVEPFQRVEVNYAGNKVSSVVIRFDRAFSADAVAKQLDLATVRPVLVSNELGEILGLAYPERGVLFAFEAGKESTKPSTKVTQLVMEPITAEPFVLRAETTLESRCDLSRRDLEQAISLEPNNARAHWLHGRVLAAMEQYEKALGAARRAVELEGDNARYRVTHAQVLAHLGRLNEALAEAEKAVGASGKRQHVKARGLCLIGDLLASGPKPDYAKALSFHTQALQTAEPLTRDVHPAIRVAAKEVLIDAHLGAAHDIAWGQWKDKGKAMARWLERALAIANDLVKNEGGNREQVFRVYVRAMAAYVGIRGAVNPEPVVKEAVVSGDEVIAAARDPLHKAQLQWDLGLALYDAVQICQIRSDHDNALKYGEQAAKYLAKAHEIKQSSASGFLLGRLYFRLGTIHATRDRDHRAAVVWFDKAIPLLERQTPEELAADLGRHGESLVSMGVSYWESGQRQKAVALSEKGIKWMERAVKQDSLDQSALAIPYGNLAAMHRKLGAGEKADRFQEMASRAKKESLK